MIEEEEQIRFNDQIDRIEFYNYLLTYIGVKENIIKTDFYQNNINDDLLDQILQNGVVLNRENRQNCLFMMKHSPAALLCAILPNQLFSIAKFFSSIQTNEKNDEMKLMFENLFMEAISESFLKDFLNRDIKEVFNDIKEIQYERRINVLADKNYNISYHNRIGVLDPKEIPVDPE